MIDVTNIEWNKVRGLNLGTHTYSNQGDNPIIWNSVSNKVEVLEGDKVLLSYNNEEVQDVFYHYQGLIDEEEICEHCQESLTSEEELVCDSCQEEI